MTPFNGLKKRHLAQSEMPSGLYSFTQQVNEFYVSTLLYRPYHGLVFNDVAVGINKIN